MTSDLVSMLQRLEAARNAANAHAVNKASSYLKKWSKETERADSYATLYGLCEKSLEDADWKRVSWALRKCW